MNNADEVVDRLLKGLRDAEAPAGLEGRVLHAMELRAAKPSSRGLYATVAVCFSVAAMWCFATLKVPPPPVMPMYHPSPAATSIPARWVAAEPRVIREVEVRHAPSNPTRLASFPAPPLPLTDQERLLLRLAHRQDANKEAALNPALHAAQMAEADKQFQQFFQIEDDEMRRESE